MPDRSAFEGPLLKAYGPAGSSAVGCFVVAFFAGAWVVLARSPRRPTR